jgi:hypothetical protein
MTLVKSDGMGVSMQDLELHHTHKLTAVAHVPKGGLLIRYRWVT